MFPAVASAAAPPSSGVATRSQQTARPVGSLADALDSRLIAGLRLALSVMALLVFIVDPWRPFPFFRLIVATLLAYLAYAGMAYLAVARRHEAARAIVLNCGVDVGFFVLLVSLTGANGSSTSYFGFFPFLFGVMVASLDRGKAAGIRLTIVAAGLFSVSMVGRASLTDDFEAVRAVLRLSCILGPGTIASLLGGYQLTLQHRLALLRDASALSNPRFGAERTIEALLARLRGFFDADVCLLVTRTAEGAPWRLYRSQRHDRDKSVRDELLPVELEETLLWLPPDALEVYDRRATHPRWWAPANHRPAEQVESLLTLYGGRSWLSVPAYYRQHWIGRLHMVGGGRLERSDVEFARRVLETGMIVVENIRLLDQLASSAADRERQRLARDIHDSVVQPYIGLQLGLSAVQRTLTSSDLATARGEVDRLRELTGVAIDDLRATVAGLKSETGAGSNSLLPALRRYATRFAQDTGIGVEVAGEDGARHRDRLDAELFQMSVEALSNIRRHTTSTRAAIWLAQDDDSVTLRIENQDPSEGGRTAFTPRSISERAAALGGRVTVDRHTDGRTIIEIKVPI
jgi:signal transduction histidine kinase